MAVEFGVGFTILNYTSYLVYISKKYLSTQIIELWLDYWVHFSSRKASQSSKLLEMLLLEMLL